jgi:hypothetical protein
MILNQEGEIKTKPKPAKKYKNFQPLKILIGKRFSEDKSSTGQRCLNHVLVLGN